MRSAQKSEFQNGYERAAAETHIKGLAGIQFTQRAQNTCLWAIGIDRAFWEGTRLIWGKARRIGLFVRSGRADEGDLFEIALEIERWLWVGYTTEGGSTGHLEVRGGGLTENHGWLWSGVEWTERGLGLYVFIENTSEMASKGIE